MYPRESQASGLSSRSPEDPPAPRCLPPDDARNLPFQFHIIFVRLQVLFGISDSQHHPSPPGLSVETPLRVPISEYAFPNFVPPRPVLLSLLPKYMLLAAATSSKHPPPSLFQHISSARRTMLCGIRHFDIPHKRGANNRSSGAGSCLSSHPPPRARPHRSARRLHNQSSDRRRSPFLGLHLHLLWYDEPRSLSCGHLCSSLVIMLLLVRETPFLTYSTFVISASHPLASALKRLFPGLSRSWHTHPLSRSMSMDLLSVYAPEPYLPTWSVFRH
ncbi:hypothetical protein LXA43DRAFT_226821 [Ganoderma leucocontextum]|nr:hypothetical protein LXA43DRAFT_226821 [Ganoderma leucocontextum]